MEEKRKALNYHNEGIAFRRIERLLGICHNTVINWVKKAAKQIKEIVDETSTKEEVDVLELDEMCTIFKKN